MDVLLQEKTSTKEMGEHPVHRVAEFTDLLRGPELFCFGDYGLNKCERTSPWRLI
jgi:hypothetical protein